MSEENELGKTLKGVFDNILSGLPTLDELEEKAKNHVSTTITHDCDEKEEQENEWTGISITKELDSKEWKHEVWHDEGGTRTTIQYCPYCGLKL